MRSGPNSQSDLDTIVDRNQELEASIQSLQDQIMDLERQVQDLECVISQKDITIDSLKQVTTETYGEKASETPSDEGVVHQLDEDAAFFDRLEKINGNPFDSDQVRAIRYAMEKHLRIISGAGSGKTQTICAKAAYLVQMSDIDEGQIVMITFTKKAATEMSERFHLFLGKEKSKVIIGTFHSVFGKMYKQVLKKYPHLAEIGVSGDDPETGEAEYPRLIQRLISKFRLQPLDEVGDRSVSDRISYWVNLGYSAEGMVSNVRTHFDPMFPKEDPPLCQRFGLFLQELTHTRRQNGWVIFDDYMTNLCAILEQSAEAAEFLRGKYRNLFIDEYQDINPLQNDIVRMICPADSPATRLTIVGDDDQSIYAFRGSAPQFIKDFGNDYPICTLQLMTNYRSKANIVQAGNRVIRANAHDRIPKAMTPHQKDNGQAGIVICEKPETEAQFIIDQAQQLGRAKPFQCGEITEEINLSTSVVLYRSEGQLMQLITVLQTRHIPFVLESKGDIFGILNSKNFRFLLRTIKLVVKGESNAWSNLFRTVALQYFVGAGKVDSWLHSIKTYPEVRYPKEFESFLQSSMKYPKNTAAAAEFIERLLEIKANPDTSIADLPKMWKLFPKMAKGTPEEEFTALREVFKNFPSWSRFYDHFQALVRDSRNMKERLAKYNRGELNALLLLTIHKSKGLAFDNVFIVGAYQGGLPDHRAIPLKKAQMEEAKGKAEPATVLEEERRLMYVAVTRAKKAVFVTLPDTGNGGPIKRSVFLKELDLEVTRVSC